jgi:hypothetical protein
MANTFKKISELAALTASGVATGDLFPVVDASAGATKRITAADLASAAVRLALGTVDVASFATGGTGTKLDPWTGWSTAIAWAGRVVYHFRPGWFALPASPAGWRVGDLTLHGAGTFATHLKYTGAADAAAAVVDLGVADGAAQVLNCRISDLSIDGGGNAGVGLRATRCHFLVLRNVAVRNATEKLVHTKWVVNLTLDNVYSISDDPEKTVSTVDGWVFDEMDPLTPSYTTVATLVNCYVTDCTRDNVVMRRTFGNVFLGGASERGGRYNLNVEAGSSPEGSKFVGFGLEAGTTMVAGNRNAFENGYGDVVVFAGNENHSDYSWVTVTVGGTANAIDVGPSTIAGNGTYERPYAIAEGYFRRYHGAKDAAVGPAIVGQVAQAGIWIADKSVKGDAVVAAPAGYKVVVGPQGGGGTLQGSEWVFGPQGAEQATFKSNRALTFRDSANAGRNGIVLDASNDFYFGDGAGTRHHILSVGSGSYFMYTAGTLRLTVNGSAAAFTVPVRCTNIGVGNSLAATGPVGAVARKIQVFDESGNSLGFVPVYSSIT